MLFSRSISYKGSAENLLLQIGKALSALQLRHTNLNYLYSQFASRINFVPYQFRPVLKHIDEINHDRDRSIEVRQINHLKNIVEQD